MVDLQYYTDYLTAMEIVHGPAFSVNPSAVIDDTQGLVSGLGGRTNLTDVGDDAYVLLARVRFASTGDDRVPVDEEGRNIGPYDMQIALASGQTELVDVRAVVPELGGSPATQLWAVMYDIDDNNQIDFGDLSFFAAAFGRTVGTPGSQPPFVWWADFDKSRRVDFGDLAFFAPNFGKSRSAVQAGTQTLVFPPNFPDAWRAGTGGGGGDGEGEARGDFEAAFDASVLGSEYASLERSSIRWRSNGSEVHADWERNEFRSTWLATLRRIDPSEQNQQHAASPRLSEWPVAHYAQSDWPITASAKYAPRRSDPWEPLEELLTLLAEHASDRLLDDCLDPYDRLFALIGG